MGRPKGPPTRAVTLNLPNATYEQIQEQARVRGTLVGTLLREVLASLYPGVSPLVMLPVKNGTTKKRK
jgi:hypothetical protein